MRGNVPSERERSGVGNRGVHASTEEAWQRLGSRWSGRRVVVSDEGSRERRGEIRALHQRTRSGVERAVVIDLVSSRERGKDGDWAEQGEDALSHRVSFGADIERFAASHRHAGGRRV